MRLLVCVRVDDGSLVDDAVNDAVAVSVLVLVSVAVLVWVRDTFTLSRIVPPTNMPPVRTPMIVFCE